MQGTGSGVARLDELQPGDVAKYFSIVIGLGVAVVAGYGLFCTQEHCSGWLGLMWSGACLFIGGLLGFLFGIPKTVQPDTRAATGLPKQRINTNLEDVSDWITKIIIGLGLAEISKIPPMLQSAAGYIGHSWGDRPQDETFGYALLAFFSIVGFLGGFLLTRIFLGPLFHKVDSTSGFTDLAQVVGAQPPSAGGAGAGAGGPDAEAVAKATAAALKAYQDIETKAPTSILAEDIRTLEALKPQFPVFRMLYIVLGRLYRMTNNIDKAIDTLTEFIENKDKAGTGHDADAGAAYYNRSCYLAVKARPLPETEREQLKQKAVEDLQNAIHRAADYRQKAQADDDLNEIRGLLPA